MKRFTNFHEWIDPTTGRVGITNFGIKELGDIVYVELPKVGQLILSGEAVCVVESTKAATDVHSPATGTVMEINELLNRNPSQLNHENAWLYTLNLSHLHELDRLMDQLEYEKFTTGK